MTTVHDIAASIRANPAVQESQLDQWVLDSDIKLAKSFYGSNKDTASDAVKEITVLFVHKFLNNSNTDEVPIRRKTKFLLVLNNFALYKHVRHTVFDAIKDLSSIFEDSMKAEGKLPFDSELGRMSEHVLVLMMRVLEYKFKAVDVHEFAEHNTQFAVQLLLAVLLKEPPYEFEMRCNCISALLGFTQPQAFFSAAEDPKDIKFHECTGFTDKVDFTLDLMLRLSALQVLNDVIVAQMYQHTTIQELEHNAVINSMRCVMNIFQYSSKGSIQWRQHVLLSTSFIDGATILYIQGQTKALETILSVSAANPKIPVDVLRGLSIALKFFAFATFQMGRDGFSIRPLCAFCYNLLKLPIRLCVIDETLMSPIMATYINFFHFLCNIDALAGDEGLLDDFDDLIPELTSEALRASIHSILQDHVAVAGNTMLEKWHRKFTSVDAGALVSRDSQTFIDINSIFSALITAPPLRQVSPSIAPSNVSEAPSATILGDMPTLAKKSQARSQKKKKKSNAEAAKPIEQIYVSKSTLSSNTPLVSSEAFGRFACALNGHTMKNPVQSPYGHNFERNTIEQWIKRQGSVCPITGKSLTIEQLTPNKALQSEIMQEVIRESMKTAAKRGTDDGGDDLYDF
eukprot:Tbor_TRINITY_DN6071_c1_g2::TRINITY_DN6071_c1_g2_i1::g.11485::m.11485